MVGDVDEAFNEADVRLKERYIQQRLIPNAIEPRATVAQPDPVHPGYVVYSATQVPHLAKIILSMATGIPENQVRVVAPDVGGGFGSKLNVYARSSLSTRRSRKFSRRSLRLKPRSVTSAAQSSFHRRRSNEFFLSALR